MSHQNIAAIQYNQLVWVQAETNLLFKCFEVITPVQFLHLIRPYPIFAGTVVPTDHARCTEQFI